MSFQIPELPTNLNVSGLTYGIAGVTAAIIVFSRLLANRPNLDAIPTFGATSWLGSWRDGYRFFRNGPRMIREGYRKYKGTAFKVAEYYRWVVVVTSREQVEELRRAPDDELSFLEAANDRLSLEYTMGHEVYTNAYHVEVVRSQLTRNIGALYPEIWGEITNAFDEELDLAGTEWKSVPALAMIQKVVCRTSNRLFVGLPLCRDPDWIDLNIRYTVDAARGGAIIRRFPKVLKPLATRLITNVHRNTKRGMKLIGPMIEERLKCLEEYGDDWADKPNDLLSWLLEEGPDRSVKTLTTRILVVNFTAVHTSSSSLTHALIYLAANPQYVQPLREEVENIVEEEGWSKMSIDKMRKIDSFLKECQRLEGIGILALSRIAVKDFTFSDGTFIPKGTMISAPSQSLHYDDEFYKNAEVFDPFRFANTREDNGEGVKHQFVSTSPEYLPFGYGRHACPGRFFAAVELKSMLAYIVVTYDIKFEDNVTRPPSLSIGTAIFPDPRLNVMFRRRAH